MRKLTPFVLSLVLLLSLAACELLDYSADSTEKDTAQHKNNKQLADVELVGPTWVLTAFESASGKKGGPGDTDITLIFHENKRLTLKDQPGGPTNMGRGRYETSSENTLRLRVGSLTEVNTLPGSKFNEFAFAAQSVYAYSIRDSTLQLKHYKYEVTDYSVQIDSSRSGAFYFEAQPTQSDEKTR